MIRKVIKIDEDKCIGCGLCTNACHEGAIKLENGKAKLIRDDYCDGLGNCLPVCPTNAISFEEREAAAYDKEAVKVHKVKMSAEKDLPCGCPGSNSRSLGQTSAPEVRREETYNMESKLNQWPVQIKLVPVNAPYFNNANLLIAADCTAFAYADFHNKFMNNKITLIGCPKLDEGDYSEKLTEIIKNNNIKSVQVLRMEVPCCGGIENAVKTALQNSGKMIPWGITTLSVDGHILEQ